MLDSNVTSTSAGSAAPKRGERSIGAILIDAGRLKPEDAERIMRLQREQPLRFGDAAIQLGLLNQADIQYALSRQFDYPYLLRGENEMAIRSAFTADALALLAQQHGWHVEIRGGHVVVRPVRHQHHAAAGPGDAKVGQLLARFRIGRCGRPASLGQHGHPDAGPRSAAAGIVRAG